jgi:chromosome segregation ATPase
MTVEDFKDLKDRLDRAQERKSNIKGRLQQIEKDWKEKYQLNTVVEVNAKIEELEESEADLDEKIKAAQKRIEACLPQD